MQELHHKTCDPIFRDLIDIKQLIVAYHHPANVRDLLMPSKLKTSKEEKFAVSTHINNTSLENCIEDINYDEIRSKDIQEERNKLSS